MRRTIQDTFTPHSFPSIDAFSSGFNLSFPTGQLEITDSLPIQLKWFNRGADTTFVIFSAAITRRAATEVPVFTGWNTTKHLKSNILMISDPSLILNTDLNLSWYFGSLEQPFLVDRLHQILSTISKFNRIVLFGASGGGFAALTQAAMLPNSTALVSNPQTDITKFSYYPKYIELAWNSQQPIKNVSSSVIEAYTKPVDARIIYIQNSQDTDHMKNHFQPFMEAKSAKNKILALTPALSEGHIGPSPTSFREIFTLVTSTPDWNKLQSSATELDIRSTRTE